MSLQTQWMRNTKDREIEVCKDDKGFFCMELVNHPTPSGCERWLPTYSDKRRWPDEATARAKFDELLAEIDKAMNEKFGELAGSVPKAKGA
jgi:microsomal dipeptidase-like Zn-dependent dipeptidase